ncbi:uncharacterized protein LOC117782620 [Drosophila innubila]|uniref:uncharacterized protein LOC117782620 n=1 Tax=Drosophila innubila TaxID=198719 RepID=UPI00148C7A63|nr:uncharacterized protein LOC117782620 [Drosophila innubila]
MQNNINREINTLESNTPQAFHSLKNLINQIKKQQIKLEMVSSRCYGSKVCCSRRYGSKACSSRWCCTRCGRTRYNHNKQQDDNTQASQPPFSNLDLMLGGTSASFSASFCFAGFAAVI